MREREAKVNDVDIEMIELADLADELAAETCRKCGAVGESVTEYRGIRDDGKRAELYRCSCGHVTQWVNGRRLS